jgi:hypothetical protein
MYILAVLALARVSSLNSSICNGCGCAACVAHDAPSTDNRHCRSVVKYWPFARRRHTCCHHTARGALPAVAQPQQSRYGKRCTALFRLVELDNAVAVIERLMRPAHRLITSLGTERTRQPCKFSPFPFLLHCCICRSPQSALRVSGLKAVKGAQMSTAMCRCVVSRGLDADWQCSTSHDHRVTFTAGRCRRRCSRSPQTVGSGYSMILSPSPPPPQEAGRQGGNRHSVHSRHRPGHRSTVGF